MLYKLTVCLCILSLLTGGETRPPQSSVFEASQEPTCGYRSCNAISDTMLNVHLVPHTHDDVGWLKTVDQYFYGDHNDIQNAGVQYILDSVVQELLKDPSKRFIYVEIAFFARWWREQDENMKASVRQLVNEGRLEFTLGGWCMNDEASTHYNAIIDQHTLGFTFLAQNFGECARPRIGWQIDPFGHSREQASIFAQFGFDGLFFGHLDYQDKDLRLNQTNMEIVWRGSPENLGDRANLFTGVLYNGYGPPGGFCWDLNCRDDPMMDDNRLHDVNIKQKVQDFIKAAHDQAKHYRSNNIMMTMGSDFQYQNAHTWYKNMDKLIKYVNEEQKNGSDVNVLYSTPSCYTFNVNHLNQIWTGKTDDFFPYANRGHSFWTGYFSSRAALKGYVRRSNNFLQVSKQLSIVADIFRYLDVTEDLQAYMEALGVAQHHDAVSGTEKQHVADDYAVRLSEGQKRCQKMTNKAFGRLMPKGSAGIPDQIYCNLLNISRCEFTESLKKFVMTAYNPLVRAVTHWVRIPVTGSAYKVTDPNGIAVLSQIVPIPEATKKIPERNGSAAEKELVFKVSIPALGFSSYTVQESNEISLYMSQASEKVKLVKGSGEADPLIENEHLSLTYDAVTGRLKRMHNKAKNVSADVNHYMAYYKAFNGNCSKDVFQASGAYVFRPNGSELHNFTDATVLNGSYIIRGDLVTEVHIMFSNWVTEVVRLYEDSQFAEIEWTVGPIPVKDNIGKEIVAMYETNIASNGLFYTDANGREILERRRNYRKTWELNQTEPISGNYYPVNSRIFIKDATQDLQFTVLNDRSEGGSSIKDGQVELMLHRRLLVDDHFGVGEPLDEKGADGEGLIVRGKHFILLDTKTNSAKQHRTMALRQYMAPSVSFSPLIYTPEQWSTDFHTSWSSLKTPLPENVHMLTLERYRNDVSPITPIETNTVLVRFEHIFEKGEDIELSQPVTINVDNFVPFRLNLVDEMTLGGNLALKNLDRLPWDYIPDPSDDGDNTALKEDRMYRLGDVSLMAGNITLQPMEIRTFLAQRVEP